MSWPRCRTVVLFLICFKVFRRTIIVCGRAHSGPLPSILFHGRFVSMCDLLWHYKNTPIQIYKKVLPPKTDNFQIEKNSIFFIFLLKT